MPGKQSPPQMLRIAALTLVLLTPVLAAKPAIYAGIARTDITPPMGSPMYGYSSRTEGAEGVLDSLTATVLVLKSDEATVALVSLDVGKFQSPWLHDQAQALGLDHIILLSSHTHAGPRFTDDFPRPEATWHQTVEQRVLAAIKAARKDLFPAAIAVGEGSIQVGYNRLRRDPNGLATTLFENHDHIPYGPLDPTVGVIRVDDNKGRTRAVLVNYTCHPVVLGPRNMRISGDYVGVMKRRVEASLGGRVLCLFAQGGCGDINPMHQGRSEPVDYDADYALVVKVGEVVAGEVLNTLGRMEGTKGASVQLRARTEVVTVGHRWEPGKTLRLGVASLLINGEIGIVALPGEVFHTLQVDLKEKAALPHVYLFGYADMARQDWPGYLPDVASAARGGYGASDSGVAELGTGERLISVGLVQLYTLREMLFAEPQQGRRP